MDEHRRTSKKTAADLAFHLLIKRTVQKIVKELSTSGNGDIQRGTAGLIARELLPRNFGFVNCSLESMSVSRALPKKGGEQHGAF